ncbi:MAG TPA: hypothetical protein VH370_23920 [Humisphaera sp.]|nr:hypothetical protein [Humisphaera sp.]
MIDDAGNPDSSSTPETSPPLAPPPLAPPPLPGAVPLSQPEAIPVAALAYSSVPSYMRPQILTGVGVMSIIVAIISGLASLMQGCQAVGLMVISQSVAASSRSGGTIIAPPTVTIQASPAPAVQVPTTPPAPVVTGANGLDVADRDMAIATLSSLRRLSAPRRTELEVFLAEDGQQVFPTGGRALTAAQVRANVSRSTVIPAGEDDTGAIQYVTVWGKLTVYDDRVEFNPSGASQPLVTSSSPAVAGNVGLASYTPLTQAQVHQAIATVQARASVALNPAQLAALSAQLQNPQQMFVPTGNATMPVMNATDMGNGRVWIMFASGSCIEIDTIGVVTTSNILAASPFTSAKISVATIAVIVLEALASAGLAVLLLVAGIILFRDSSSARRLHLIFAGAKIVAVVVGWIAMTNLVGGFFSAAGGRSTVPLSGLFTVTAAVYGIALIYPIALFFIFRLRGVRDYYNSVQ